MSLQWLENWVTPGVCLLARSEVHNRGLAGAVANGLMSPSGVWMYVHKNEAMVIDAPFAWEDAGEALDRIESFLRASQLRLKFATCSHLHLDHSAGLSALLERFPDATFVFPDTWKKHWRSIGIDRAKCGVQPQLSECWERASSLPYEDTISLNLAGEPLHFIEAPYHSVTDQLVIFRGFALLPDWHLPGEFNERLAGVDAPPAKIRETIHRIRQFACESGYSIHQSCAAHGDEPLRFDFQDRIDLAYQRFVMDS